MYVQMCWTTYSRRDTSPRHENISVRPRGVLYNSISQKHEVCGCLVSKRTPMRRKKPCLNPFTSLKFVCPSDLFDLSLASSVVSTQHSPQQKKEAYASFYSHIYMYIYLYVYLCLSLNIHIYITSVLPPYLFITRRLCTTNESLNQQHVADRHTMLLIIVLSLAGVLFYHCLLSRR